MYRLGTWTAQAISRLRGVEVGGQRIAAVMGISGALILVSGVVEIVATAVFYTSLVAAVLYIFYQWLRSGGAP